MLTLVTFSFAMQAWTGDVFEIQAVQACRFLNVQGGGLDPGTGLCVWDTAQGVNPHNLWRISSVRGAQDPMVVEILSNHAQRYLNLKAGHGHAGADVQLWDAYRDPPNPDNFWKMVPVPGMRDVYEIQSCASGRFLNVRAGSSRAGAAVCVWDTDFGSNPAANRWRIIPADPVIPDPAGLQCVVCLTSPATMALVHSYTAHLCVCLSCACTLDTCPMCRSFIQWKIRVFV